MITIGRIRLLLRALLGATSFFLCWLPSSTVSAATIEQASSANCTVRLEGQIEAGDHARLQVLLASLNNPSLCLNSPGGIYAEALKIVELMLATKAGVGTVVDQGSECLSACAIVFLAGHVKEGANVHASRKLHVGATLGFHGPYVRVSNPNYDASIAARAHVAGIRAIARLIELDREALFPSSLLSLALTKGADEYLYVTDVFAAGAWDIDLIGFLQPAKLTTAMLQQACDNYEEWKIWYRAPPDEPVIKGPGVGKDRSVNLSQGRGRVTFKDYGDEAAFSCAVDIFDGGPKGTHIMTTIFDDIKQLPRADVLQRAIGRGELWKATPLWYVFSPKSTIKSLAR